jgi:glucosamine 6-phosphate synthetase-like amidotransferase/phosphosugar isomerase protein
MLKALFAYLDEQVINLPINCCYLEIFRITGIATKYAIIKINGSFETADLVLILRYCRQSGKTATRQRMLVWKSRGERERNVKCNCAPREN